MSQAPKPPKREKVDTDEAYGQFHVLVFYVEGREVHGKALHWADPFRAIPAWQSCPIVALFLTILSFLALGGWGWKRRGRTDYIVCDPSAR